MGIIRAYHAGVGYTALENHVSQRLFQCPITCHDGFIYVGQGGSGGDTNRYYCLDTDGTLIWEYASETVGYLWSGASVVGDYLVFANHDAVLTCLNRSDGSLVDELDLYSLTPDAGKARASVSYSNGFILTTSESGLNSATSGKSATTR
jgi:outer membrane protein assembly factor BamB